MRRRKTAEERGQDRMDARALAWKEFRPKLAALQTYAEALLLVNQAPPESTPGRCFYSNLGFFLQGFTPPLGASGDEKSLYVEFIHRLDSQGLLKPGVGQRAVKALQSAISEQWW